MTPTGRLSTFFFLRNKLQVVVALNGRTGTVCATIYLKMWSFLEKFILLINFSGGSSECGEQSGSRNLFRDCPFVHANLCKFKHADFSTAADCFPLDTQNVFRGKTESFTGTRRHFSAFSAELFRIPQNKFFFQKLKE